jgi:hypothetical protein
MRSQINTLPITSQRSRLPVRTHIQVGNKCTDCEKQYEIYYESCNKFTTEQGRDTCHDAANVYLDQCRNWYKCPVEE